jgi:EAL domain-containing protein (putative c-di-GMP-specific phosphodiesterase class I)
MSIGIAISETGACAPDRLLLEADVAMYHAKARGKAHHQVFHQELLEGMLERVELEAALRRAIERDELVLHYQPKVAGATGAMVGVEALVRWQRNDTLVGPGAFIGVAEDSGLILPIGEWVIHTACAQLGDWTRRHPDAEMSMAVNVSTRQLQRDGLVAIVREALQDSGVAPERLVLELTESALEDHVDAAGETLAELKSLGVQLSIDDFGTGYSSLDRLRSFAIDELKIDRSFVEEIDHPDADAPLVTAVIAMAHGLGRRVVAEGVETHAQLRYLLVRGCDVIQGYLVGRPDVPDVVTRALSSGPDGRRAEVS